MNTSDYVRPPLQHQLRPQSRRAFTFSSRRLVAASLLIAAAFLAPSPAYASLPELANLPKPTVPSSAMGESAIIEAGPQVSAHLLVESESIAAGKSFRVGILFAMEPGWHIYWRNPGDSALPTRITWLVEDATVGELQWPIPEVFHEPETGYTTYGYSGAALLANEMTIHSRVDGPVTLGAQIKFLACKEICIPGSIGLERTLLLGAPIEVDSDAKEVFDFFEARLPHPLGSGGLEVATRLSQDAVRPGDSFLLGIGAASCIPSEQCEQEAFRSRDPSEVFIPYIETNPTLIPLGVQAFPNTEGGYLVAMRGHVRSDAEPRTEDPLRGILALADGGYVEVAVAFPTADKGSEIELIPADWLDPRVTEAPPAPTGVSIGLGYALALALLGGLILNLMPCVLPVLAIKLVSLSELVHQERRVAAANGLAYGAGIQASMGILTAVVLALRQAGVAVGWGFQFQEPMFLVAIAILVVLFACNLFGWFEINLNTSGLDALGRDGSALRRSFFDGFLAVALATPCSAPFLGTAVGFAFAGDALDIVSVFAMIGAGLALPFVAASLVPGMARLIPAPGKWMMQLRVGLGVALLVTGLWLLWVLERTAGAQSQALVALLLAATAAGAFALGRIQRDHPGTTLRLYIAGFAAALAVAVAVVPLDPVEREAASQEGALIAWQPFANEAIAAELATNRPVFVYFTADWCITCKVNEGLVLEDGEVIDALARHNVATFKGDWTHRDEAIRLELARHGKAGVPVYLVYSPKRPNAPHVLPELITVDVMLKALDRAAPRPAS